MSTSLVVPTSVATELQAVASLPLETAGVLLADIVESANADRRLLAREVVWVEESAYARRQADSLSIRSHGYVPALGRAERIRATAIWLHTHPGMGAIPLPSKHDEVVDHELADLFRLRTGSPYYGALILSPRPLGIAFSGHLKAEDGRVHSIDRLWEIGDRFRLLSSFSNRVPAGLPATFDRNVRAFGSAVQQTLNSLRVGIVGCGGTGSSVAEQLVRLGVQRFMLVDPDVIADSNLSRVYGSTIADVGRPKVDVLSAHLARICPSGHIEAIRAMIVQESAAKRLADCDVVFGCTDDNAGRLVLSRAATYLLTPVIDCGVLLTSGTDGQLTGIDGRVTTLVPGQGCLVCRGRVDIARAAAELLTPEERKRRVDEGYAPALGAAEPAVVTFTTAVAAAAVSELLERLIGYGPEPRPSEILLRFHDREISTNRSIPRAGHYCDPASGRIGSGNTQPFLDQAWPD